MDDGRWTEASKARPFTNYELRITIWMLARLRAEKRSLIFSLAYFLHPEETHAKRPHVAVIMERLVVMTLMHQNE